MNSVRKPLTAITPALQAHVHNLFAEYAPTASSDDAVITQIALEVEIEEHHIRDLLAVTLIARGEQRRREERRKTAADLAAAAHSNKGSELAIQCAECKQLVMVTLSQLTEASTGPCQVCRTEGEGLWTIQGTIVPYKGVAQ